MHAFLLRLQDVWRVIVLMLCEHSETNDCQIPSMFMEAFKALKL